MGDWNLQEWKMTFTSSCAVCTSPFVLLRHFPVLQIQLSRLDQLTQHIAYAVAAVTDSDLLLIISSTSLVTE